MLNGLRSEAPVLVVMLFTCVAGIVYAAIAQTLPPPQSEEAPQLSSDALVESLEKALSEGKAEKAHDLLTQILKRPHLTSDFLLRVGIQFAEQELY